MSEENQKAKDIFSKNFCYWLRRRKKTREDVCKALKVKDYSVADWCCGRRMPRTHILLRIKDWLAVDLEDLLCEQITRNNPINDVIFKLKDDKDFFKTVSYFANLDDKDEVKVFYKIMNKILNLNDEDKIKVNEYIDLIELKNTKNKKNSKLALQEKYLDDNLIE